jgi:hypothetical protein
VPLIRTYPAEWSTIGADETIVSSIRDRIGDRPELRRYYILANSDNMNRYVMDDKVTFTDSNVRLWPYHLSINQATVTSGIDVLNYKYINLGDSDNDLTADLLDFWVETFYLSDFEVWSAYLNVDLTSYVNNPECIVEEMEILKAAIDLVPALRTSRYVQDVVYSDRRVKDNDTEYQSKLASGVDPYKDLISKLQGELDKLLDRCNKTPYVGGYRVE